MFSFLRKKTTQQKISAVKIQLSLWVYYKVAI